MPRDFWETSSAAKLYLNEIGSEWVTARMGEGEGAISALVHAEMASLLARRCAEGEFDADIRDEIYGRYLGDTNRFEVLEVTDGILKASARLILSGIFGTRVRASDAIHLATAQRWFEQARRLNIESGAFVVADKALRDAAVALGLAVENPEDYE
jgi:predicted nucleic acid-binding protein